MSHAYFKRFRMEIGFRALPPVPRLDPGYFWVPWDERILDLHAEVQYRSFCDEVDSTIFPCFGHRCGCQTLLREIRNKPEFIPDATWLIAWADGCCGTVQGVADRRGYGVIQNVGVTPAHRGRGLGKALLLQAMQGFRRHGLRGAYLEVTAHNARAVRLYQGLGFRKMKTVYKAVDVPLSVEASVVF